MIGASPRIDGLEGLVGLDDNGFILTGDQAARHRDFSQHWDRVDRHPLQLATTRRDVFAVGDVRAGFTKRIASALGDDALLVRSIHESLDELQARTLVGNAHESSSGERLRRPSSDGKRSWRLAPERGASDG